MFYKNIFSGSAAIAVLLLAGCSAPQVFYVMPDPTQPAAQLKINGSSGWSVQRRDVDCSRLGKSGSRKLTYLADYPEERHSNEPPFHVEVTLPAGLSTFNARYSHIDKTCFLDFDSLLVAGRKYEMKLEFEYRGVFRQDQCRAVIVDAETGASAPTFSTDFKGAPLFADRAAIRDEAGCRRRAGLLQSGLLRNGNR